ncbi:hypothetical protein RRG08_021711 [Elysia crispata]|uniref:Uncharacterized protein n=1 Tax=Elysia crispata TaxID=231223 RepID=A0AAE0ZXP7_9GAST|nr:hypothetical protein RRG08_021711 [Elysia crispata]
MKGAVPHFALTDYSQPGCADQDDHWRVLISDQGRMPTVPLFGRVACHSRAARFHGLLNPRREWASVRATNSLVIPWTDPDWTLYPGERRALACGSFLHS